MATSVNKQDEPNSEVPEQMALCCPLGITRSSRCFSIPYNKRPKGLEADVFHIWRDHHWSLCVPENKVKMGNVLCFFPKP